MPIPLTLGMPPSREEPRGLLTALLTRRHPTLADALAAPALDAIGDPVVPVSTLTEALGETTGAVRIVGELDVAPDAERLSGLRPVPVRYQLDCTAADLDDALAVAVPAPLTVYVDAGDLPVTARALVGAGHSPGLPTGRDVGEIADFLSVLAHAGTGYVARARDADEVLALLAATVAALRGDDVRAALAAPDPGRLTALIPEAAAAVREILLTVEVDDPAGVARDLAALGLAAR
ncbi:hypothetical protein ACWEQV_19815 [Rhodococcus aetherivorans]|uniref:hypothetical protein n=1 Tax=Rhodococcus aetherivorans TaxID=191292 RepID=UPI0002D21E80|nr:hypothetical protein [Rhodococcus aetherivorans]CCW14384.1 hypothetical protein EBESD8_49530 [Rhodococcus aetherivorans]